MDNKIQRQLDYRFEDIRHFQRTELQLYRATEHYGCRKNGNHNRRQKDGQNYSSKIMGPRVCRLLPAHARFFYVLVLALLA
jgi:hypothetical protein